MFLQSLRMTQRDWRAGELRFLLVALIVAVAALSSVGFFVDRMRAGMTRDAAQLLGADLLLSADQPLTPDWRAQATAHGLRTAETAVFPSMAIVGQGDSARSLLSSIKAVSAGYPLRGQLNVSPRDDGSSAVATSAIPAPGTVWVDAAILSGLGAHVGDTLTLGDKPFVIARVIDFEPDRGAGFVNFAPRVMVPLSDLPATNLIQFGSRVTYRLLMAGDSAAVTAYEDQLEDKLDDDSVKGMRLESLQTGRPEMRATLDRAEQFLSLVGLLSAMLAAIAVAMAARRFMLRHLDACAMLRCLGMTQNQVTAMYLIEFVLLGLIGSALGALAGFAAHFALLQWLAGFIPRQLPPAGWMPALQGIATGLLLLVGFALPPLLQLRNVPHNRVIRREQDAPQPLTVASYALGTAVFIGLLLWQARDLKLGLLTAAGFLGGFAVFALVAWLALRGLKRLRSLSGSHAWRFALTGLQRRPGATIMQIVALGLGLMALLLLTVIRGDLVGAWRQTTPPDAPNRFIINIQNEQKAPLEQLLRQNGVPQPQLYPMIRGRLVSINGKAVSEDDYPEDRAKRLLDREFNLSTMMDMPPQNTLVTGRWYDDSKPEASVEEGLAKTLHLKMGDQLTFDMGGQTVTAPITSLRKLEWGSLRVNFFVIINPRAMVDMPQTWITAFHIGPVKAAGTAAASPAGDNNGMAMARTLSNRLARDFPNLTVVDIGNILKQIQDAVDQVVAAVEFLFLFTLASGILVLYAAMAASHDQRIREAGLLRALGATRRQLAQAQAIEFGLVGALAGLLAASGAAAIGWALAHYVFDFEWHFDGLVWLAGMLAGAVCALLGGWAGLRNVLNRPPLASLREA